MSNLVYCVLFTAIGVIIGLGLALLLGYKHSLKRKAGTSPLQKEMEKFFNGFNTERNILGDLRRLNPERCKAFGHSVKEKSILFWATELGGETGELLNWIKKLDRGDNIPTIKEEIAKEAADVVVSLDLLCIHQDIDLQGAIIQKFNETSDHVKSPIKL